MSSLLFPVYKSGGESAQPENMCDIVLKKVKGRGGTGKIIPSNVAKLRCNDGIIAS